ncbi:alpha/beta fold hydrolase [uncultured Jatrophihabitans sp.]|uniref:alpha/beta fold hydrolase n=1 Tax=uncultured Jatrophihabitans sp. TaxID=1610747 RepID=UPI0035C9AA7C
MQAMTAPRPRTRVPGVHYVVTGDAPRTIVLLHGYTDNVTTWQRVVPVLAASHRVIAIDLPGFGASSRPWSTPLLSGYVDVVREVLDAEGVDGPVSLMGNSMGAAVSTLFGARYPERTDGMVLIDMPGMRGVPQLWRLGLSRPAELAVRAALRCVPSRTAQFGLGWVYSHIAVARPRDLDPSVRRGFCDPYALRDSVAGLMPIGRALVRELRSADLGGLVARSEAPALVVFGARDVLTPARVLRRIGRPGGAVVLPGCGHCPQIDQPAALLSEVLPFLRASRAEHRAADHEEISRTARSA